MERIIILGGNNTLGQIIARHLLTAGMKVTVFSDAVNDLKISHQHYRYVRGDVYNIYSVSQAIEGFDAIISVYSSTYMSKMFYLRDALQNILRSMAEKNVNRLIFLSYSDRDYTSVLEKQTNPMIKKILGIDYDLKRKKMFAETIRKSGLNYTINYLDQEFLEHFFRTPTSEKLKKYYFFIADEIQKQLILNNSIGSELTLLNNSKLQSLE